MKAIQFTRIGTPDVLELVDIERPTPGTGEVLIKINSSAVSFGDINARRGDLPSPHFLWCTPRRGIPYYSMVLQVA